MSRILIDLDAVGTGSKDPSQSIRRTAFSRVLQQLYEAPAASEETDDVGRRRPLRLDVMPYRRHDTILVSARRGDGKTTFLTDVLSLIQQAQKSGSLARHLPPDFDVKEGCSLYSLGIIDPTLIENKQNIVVIIIERIKAAVDRTLDTSRSDASREYDDFKGILHELASGLTLLDGIGEDAYGKDWADADYVLDKGLDRAQAASAFERAFHRYVAKACDFVRSGAFVLAIDDVDTWFDRGWPVLEALRKYLATPRLKIIMAGDMKLYSLLVRQHQWSQMTPGFVDAERKAPDETSQIRQIGEMIDTLQDQYLIKIARPENRIDLRPLIHSADEVGIDFRSSKASGMTIPESVVTERYARRLLAINAPDDMAVIRSTFLRLPVRSSLQALSGAWSLLSAPETSARASSDLRFALDALRHVTSTRLMSFDLDENELRDPDPRRIFGVLSTWLTRRGIWLSMSRFHPEGADEGSDLVAIFLGAMLVEVFHRSPRSMIDYWLRICVIREMVDVAEVAQVPPKGARSELVSLLDHSKAGTNERLTQFVSRLAAWDARGGLQVARGIRMSGFAVPARSRLRVPEVVVSELYGLSLDSFDRRTFASVANGSDDALKRRMVAALPVPLRGYHQTLIDHAWRYRQDPVQSGRGGRRPQREVGLVVSYANSIESLKDQLVSGDDATSVALLPALQVVSGQSSVNGYYSFLRLLAFVAELIDLAARPGLDASKIRALLSDLATSRSYPTPATEGAGATQGKDAVEDGEGGEAGDDGATKDGDGEAIADGRDDLAGALFAWLRATQDGSGWGAKAPLDLGRIWTRFSYAFASVRDKLRHTRTRYLGVLMHRTVTAFLHAVGVESLRRAGHELGPKVVDNPIESSEPFRALLQQIRAAVGDGPTPPELALFEALFSCPLWGYFLARSDEEIVGKSKRPAAAQVFEQYGAAVSSRVGWLPTFAVRLRCPEDPSPVATFRGLFHILNTVQLQGQRAGSGTRTNTSTQLSNTLSEIASDFEDLASLPAEDNEIDGEAPGEHASIEGSEAHALGEGVRPSTPRRRTRPSNA